MPLKKKLLNELKEWAKALTFALFVGALVILFARPSFINGPSMEPSFYDKSVVLVEKISYMMDEPERLDIVVTTSSLPWKFSMTKNLIKRVIGLPGDHILISEGQLFVNSELVYEPYLKTQFTTGTFEGVVPTNHYFVMGDNRAISSDSRNGDIGYISKADIKGKVYFRIFPFADYGKIDNR